MKIFHTYIMKALGIAVIIWSAMFTAKADLKDSIIVPVPTLATATVDEIREARLRNSHRVVEIGKGNPASYDSIQYLVNKFYYDQYRHFKDPMAPYFLLMSKDASLAMGVGGCVRMRGWFDFAGSMPVNGFTPMLIPVPSDPAYRRRIGGTPGGTSIFMRVIGRNPVLGDVIADIQGNFQNDNEGFKLKKAYVTINDWTIGYNTTTFSDVAAEVPTIDGAGQNGKTGTSAMLVRWDHRFGKSRWSMAAALELPRSQVACDGIETQALHDWFPDLATYGQYNFDHGGHIRVGGLLRVLPYRDLVTATNRNRIGWGVQLSGVWSPWTRFTIYGEFNTGQGYQSTMGDLSVGSYDLVAVSGTPGRLYTPFAMGLTAGLRYSFFNNLYACLALGEAKYFPKNEVEGSNYKYGLYGALNLFYEPTSRLQVGIEYLTGSRHNFNGMHGSANRIDALFQFSF